MSSSNDLVFDHSFEPTPKKVFELSNKLVINKNTKPNHSDDTDDFLQNEVSFEPIPKRYLKEE